MTRIAYAFAVPKGMVYHSTRGAALAELMQLHPSISAYTLNYIISEIDLDQTDAKPCASRYSMEGYKCTYYALRDTHQLLPVGTHTRGITEEDRESLLRDSIFETVYSYAGQPNTTVTLSALTSDLMEVMQEYKDDKPNDMLEYVLDELAEIKASLAVLMEGKTNV